MKGTVFSGVGKFNVGIVQLDDFFFAFLKYHLVLILQQSEGQEWEIFTDSPEKVIVLPTGLKLLIALSPQKLL